MPDGDKLPLGIYGLWRRVFRSLQDRDPLERTQDAILRALASDVRHRGGIGALASPPTAVPRQFNHDQREPPPGPTVDQIEQLRSALTTTVIDQLSLVSPREGVYALVERIAKDHILDRLHRMAVVLTANGDYGSTEINQVIAELTQGEQMIKTLNRIVDHPTGEGLKAPNRRIARLPHDEFLETSLGDLHDRSR